MTDRYKEELHASLRDARDAVIWKCQGLSEYDIRRPLTNSGTNLLGLVKHLAVGEAWYFGQVFDRPFTPHLPWWDDNAQEGIDLWAAATESRQQIIDTYCQAIAHADATIAALDLDASGHVLWWSRPEVSLHGILVHVLAETTRHAGHADILREQLDGSIGVVEQSTNVTDHSDQWWRRHRSTIEDAAREAAGRDRK